MAVLASLAGITPAAEADTAAAAPLDGIASPAPMVDVTGSPSDGTTSFVPPKNRSSSRTLAKLSDIQVTYHGFSSAQKTAFEYATTLWERLVASKVPIKVDATLTSLPYPVLGSAAPTYNLRNFAGAPRADTDYPAALANARAGTDLNPSSPDIRATIDSETIWATGTDGEVTSGEQEDLVTVALHELGHGLGISGKLKVSGSTGSWSGSPTAWDRLVGDGSNNAVINAGNGTPALKAKLTSGQLRFLGATAVARNGGAVPLYSPNPFTTSSVFHLDSGRLTTATDFLMAQSLQSGHAIHDPGDVIIGALHDIGWTTTSDRLNVPPTPTITRVSAGNGSVTVAWSPAADDGRYPVTTWVLRRYTNGSNTPEQTTIPRGSSRSFRLTGLTNGADYRFDLVAHNQVGDSPVTAKSKVARPLNLGPFADVDEFLQRQYADIVHRGPSATALVSRRDALNTGATSVGQTVVDLMGDTVHTASVPPVIRLYLAYFKRLPDQSGLAYWSGKARAGQSLKQASDQFVMSSEFVRTYGSLSDPEFVDLVYVNVLGRPGDPGGRSFWIGKLRSGASRGSMMTSFSESSENIRKTADKVNAVALKHVLLAKVPSAADATAAETRLAGGTPLATLADEILRSDEYFVHLGKTPPLPVGFQPGTAFADVPNPSGFAKGDLNGDGRDDLAFITGSEQFRTETITVLLHKPTGGYAPAVTTAPLGPYDIESVAIGDVVGDVHPDVLVGTQEGIKAYPGSATGALGAVQTLVPGTVANANGFAIAGDLTNDGLADLAAVPWNKSKTVSVFARLAGGGYGAPATYPDPNNTMAAMTVADIDGDGRNDLITETNRWYLDDVGWQDPQVAILLQTATGTLGPATVFPVHVLSGLAVADVTGDGRADVMYADSTSAGKQLGIISRPGGSYTTTTMPATGLQGNLDLASGDVDGDGSADVIVPAGQDLGVFLQKPGGGLATMFKVPFSGDEWYAGKAMLSDVDGDGRLDLIRLGYYYLQR
jgi:hypothetical protein